MAGPEFGETIFWMTKKIGGVVQDWNGGLSPGRDLGMNSVRRK